ncbi:MAG: methyltransferase domain-containing protein [Deltaproteobacteria bacterium]|nr:methyltransferase domain-containing protein [Deltaproteobacteria bacterium]
MTKTEPFELYCDAYDDWFLKNAEKYEVELEIIHGLLPLPVAKGVEIGVGSGRFAEPLGIRFGLDPSHKMALKAKKRGIKVIQGAAENLPFSDAGFDFALMVTTICFVDDVIKSFTETHRVLKPGGCIIVGFVEKESEIGRSYIANRERSKFYRDATFYSAGQVLEFLNEAGFRIEKVKQTLIPGDLQKTILDGFGKGAFVAISGLK